MRKLLVVVLLALAPACSESIPAERADLSIVLPAGMTRVTDRDQVCMVNDHYMGKPQIPVRLAGTTYYACCTMCQVRLGNEPATRTSRDPVTGQPVDKARAVIIRDGNGKVMYFASEDTLRQFRG